MSFSKKGFFRYKVIDELLRNSMRPYPTMQVIIKACFDKLKYSPCVDTIQKDIANMRLPSPGGFDAPIRYNREKNGYEYTDPDYSLLSVSLRQEEIEAINEAVEVIKSIGGARISDNFNHAVEKVLSTTLEKSGESKDTLPVLQTMVPPVSRGFEYFDLFHRACREYIPTSFIYFSYKKRKYNHIILHPFLIKEFENRWYIIGYSEQHKGIRTFGLDRVSVPVLLKRKFKHTNTDIIKNYLNDIYGAYPIPRAKKERITIHVSQLWTHYFQAYPLHASQDIVKENAGTSHITFELIATFDLAKYFLSQGSHVKIVKPQWFIEYSKNLHK